jgi:hypothetical protein
MPFTSQLHDEVVVRAGDSISGVATSHALVPGGQTTSSTTSSKLGCIPRAVPLPSVERILP